MTEFEKSIESFQARAAEKKLQIQSRVDEATARILQENKDLWKKTNLYQKTTPVAQKISDLESFTFNSLTDSQDADTIRMNGKPVRLGSTNRGVSIDAYETAKYEKDAAGEFVLDETGNKKLLPYKENVYDAHRQNYADTFGFPSKEFVSQEMLNQEAEKQTSKLLESIYKGTTWAEYGVTPTQGEMVPFPAETQSQLDFLNIELDEAIKLEKINAKQKEEQEILSGTRVAARPGGALTAAAIDAFNWLKNEIKESKDDVSVAEIREQIRLVKLAANQTRPPIDPTKLTGDVVVDIRKDGVDMYDRDLGTLYNPITKENINTKANTPANNPGYMSYYNKEFAKFRIDAMYAAMDAQPSKGWGFWKEMEIGVRGGLDNVQATGWGFAALYADATGDYQGATEFLDLYMSELDSALERGAQLPSIEEMDWTDWDLIKSKLGRAFGEGIPSIALMFGTGGFVGFFAKKGAQKYYAGEVSELLAAKVISRIQRWGQTTGVVVPATVMEGGGIYAPVAIDEPELRTEKRTQLLAFAGGLFAGSLESVLPASLLRKFKIKTSKLEPIKAKFGSRLLTEGKNIVNATTAGALTEGITEGAQSIISQITEEFIKNGDLDEIDRDKFISEFWNSVFAGLVPGGGIRLAGSSIGGTRRAIFTTDAQAEAAAINETLNEVGNVQNEAVYESDEVALKEAKKSRKNLRQTLRDVVRIMRSDSLNISAEGLAGFKGTNFDYGIKLLESLNQARINETNKETIALLDSTTETLQTILRNNKTGNVRQDFENQEILNNAEQTRASATIDTKADADKQSKTPKGRSRQQRYKDRVETKRQKDLDDVKQSTILKTNETNKKRSELVNKAIKAIKIPAIKENLAKYKKVTEQLKDKNLTPKQKKRLIRLQRGYGNVLAVLSKDGKAKIGAQLFSQIPSAYTGEKTESGYSIFSEEYKQKIKKIVNELSTAIDDLKALHVDDDVSAEEIIELGGLITDLILQLKRSNTEILQGILDEQLTGKDKKIFQALVQVSESSITLGLKTLNDYFNNLDSSSAVDETVEQDEVKSFNSLNIDDINKKQTVDDKTKLSDEDKKILKNLEKLASLNEQIDGLKNETPAMAEVHKEVLIGRKEGQTTFKGILAFLTLAQEDNFDVLDYSRFIKILVNKKDAFDRAFKYINNNPKVGEVYISQTPNEDGTYKVGSKVPEGTKSYTTKAGYTRYEGYWFVGETSAQLVELLGLEVEYAKAMNKHIVAAIKNKSSTESSNKKDKAFFEVLKKARIAAKKSIADLVKSTNVDPSILNTDKDKPKSKPKKVKPTVNARKETVTKAAIKAMQNAKNNINIATVIDDLKIIKDNYGEKGLFKYIDELFEILNESISKDSNLTKEQKQLDVESNDRARIEKIKEVKKAFNIKIVKPKQPKKKISVQELEGIAKEVANRIKVLNSELELATKSRDLLRNKPDKGSIEKVKSLEETILSTKKLLNELEKDKDSAEKQIKRLNHFLNKGKERFLDLKSTGNVLKVRDFFKIKDLTRDSFFSRNSDTTLTKQNIKAKLKDLGVTDTKYVKEVVNNFILFKKAYEKYVQTDLTAQELNEGIFALYNSEKMLSVVDENNKGTLPDELLFSMMLSLMHWSAINKNSSRALPRHAIALMLYGDAKARGQITPRQQKTFGDMGPTVKHSAFNIGKDTFDTLNVKGNKETEEALAKILAIQEKHPELKGILMKDMVVADRAASAIGVMALLIGQHLYLPKNLETKTVKEVVKINGSDVKRTAKNKYRVIKGGLVTINHGRYDSTLFDNEEFTDELYKEKLKVNGKVINAITLNTLNVTDKDSVNNTLDIFKDNLDNYDIIRGAKSTIREIYFEPIEEVEEKIYGSYFDTNKNVIKVLKTLQQVGHVGKQDILEVVKVLTPETLETLVKIIDTNLESDYWTDAIEASNKEKRFDLQDLLEYIKDTDKDGNLKTFYYKWKLQKQHRYRIDGNKLNYQASKIIRHWFSPSKTKIRTVKKGSNVARIFFQLAVVEGLGGKITVAEKNIEDFNNFYNNTEIQALLPLLKNPEKNSKQINTKILELIVNKTIKPSAQALEALVALSNYDSEKSFTHTLGYEIDGITNGYAHGLMQFYVDNNPKKSKEQKIKEITKQLNRIGVFPNQGKEKDTFEKFIARGELDVYEYFSDIVYKNFSTTPEILDIVDELHGKFYDEVIKRVSDFARDVAKSPVMVSSYQGSAARIVTAIVNSIIPDLYKRLANYQTEYDLATEKRQEEIKNEVKALQQYLNKNLSINVKLAARLSKEGTTENKFGVLKRNNLYGFEFEFVDTLKFNKKFKEIYQDPVVNTLQEILGPLTESKELIVHANEEIHLAFMIVYERLTEGVTNTATKDAIAQQIAADYMPKYKGPWSTNEDGTIDYIQAIKRGGKPSNPVQVTYEGIASEVFLKEGETTIQLEDRVFKNTQVIPLLPDFLPAGVGVLVGQIQNMDSVNMGVEILRDPDRQFIHDAVITDPADVANTRKGFNGSFFNLSQTHSILEGMLEQHKEVINKLSKEDLIELDKRILEESFLGKKITRDYKNALNRVRKNRNDKTLKAFEVAKSKLKKWREIEASYQFTRSKLTARIRDTKETHNLFNWTSNSVISQGYVPESVIDPNLKPKNIKENINSGAENDSNEEVNLEDSQVDPKKATANTTKKPTEYNEEDLNNSQDINNAYYKDIGISFNNLTTFSKKLAKLLQEKNPTTKAKIPTWTWRSFLDRLYEMDIAAIENQNLIEDYTDEEILEFINNPINLTEAIKQVAPGMEEDGPDIEARAEFKFLSELQEISIRINQKKFAQFDTNDLVKEFERLDIFSKKQNTGDVVILDIIKGKYGRHTSSSDLELNYLEKLLYVAHQINNLNLNSFEAEFIEEGITRHVVGLEKINQGRLEELSRDDDTSIEDLFSIDGTIEQELEPLLNFNDLTGNLLGIFNLLENNQKDEYLSKQDKENQQNHLKRILTDIVSKATDVMNETNVTINKTNIFNNGRYNIEESNVIVNANRSKPLSYSEQTAQEVYVHELIHPIIMHAIRNNVSVRNQLIKIRKQVVKEIEKLDNPYEIFLSNRDANGEILFLTNKDAEIEAAKRQYEYVFGSKSEPAVELDEFLTYGLTNKHVVKFYSQMSTEGMPYWNDDAEANNTVIEKLVGFFETIVVNLTNLIKGKQKTENVSLELIELTQKIVRINENQSKKIRESKYTNKVGNIVDTGNQIISDFLKDVGNKGLDVTGDQYNKLVDILTREGKINGFLANLLYDTKLITLLTNKNRKFFEEHPKVQLAFSRAFGKIGFSSMKNLSSLKTDLLGNVDQRFVKLLYKSNKVVDANRRQFKEISKDALKQLWGTYDDLDNKDKEILTKVLLKTDFSLLVSSGAFTMQEALELLKDKTALEAAIKTYEKGLSYAYKAQSDGLAEIMVIGETTTNNQDLNAKTIYESQKQKQKTNIKASQIIRSIDIYVSLLALNKTIENTNGLIERFNEIVNKEAYDENGSFKYENGVSGIVELHSAFKKKSLEEGFLDKKNRDKNNKPLPNETLMMKGYIASITDPDRQLVVALATAKNIKKLTGFGQNYEFIGHFPDLPGGIPNPNGLFLAKNDPDLTRNKGILSVKGKRVKGTLLTQALDALGYEPKDMMEQVQKMTLLQFQNQKIANKTQQQTDATKWVPVKDDQNNIVDYRMPLNHQKAEQYLQQDLMFDEVLPTMFSQLEDKINSEKINTEAIKVLAKYGRENRAKKPGKFINILDSRYEEEYLRPLPKQAKEDFRNMARIGKDSNKVEFWIERGLLDMVFGYQNPSISNLKLFNKFPKGQRYAKVVEKLIKEMVSLAVVNIVIKIPIVPAVNFASNFVTSMLYGVPPLYLIKKWTEGIQELRKYQTMAKELKLIDMRILAKPVLANDFKIKQRRKSLTVNMNRNKVAPFVDQGLFNSITEDINQNEFTYRNKAFNKIKEKGNKLLTGSLLNVANHAYLGEQTAIFKASMHFLQISDFVARYALYSHQTEQRGMSETKAYKLMIETFVNYDQPLNRYLAYGNDMGLILFVKYWIRIQRAGLNLLKEKPLNAATMLAGNALLDLDIETILNSSLFMGNFHPMWGGLDRIVTEVAIPPGLQILAGEGF